MPPSTSAPTATTRRTTSISDSDFWEALKHLKRKAGSDQLGAAIESGKAGDHDTAWLALASWHRQGLACEYDYVREQVLQQALAPQDKRDALYANRINVWHSLIIDFGPDIDWNTTHLGKPIPGFHYFGWFLPAVRDLYTGNQDARDFVERIILSYRRDLPGMQDTFSQICPGNGHVMGRLPCMGKIRAFLSAYLYLIRQDDIKPAVIAAFNQLFLGMARAMQICMNQEARSKAAENGNISIAGASVLFRYGKLFPEYRESAAWRKRGAERFVHFSRTSFYADGGYCERVWGYGAHALGHLTDGYVTARRYGGFGKHDKEIRTALRRCFRWYAKTLGPNERQPTFGDGESSPTPVRKALNLAAQVFPESRDRYLGVDRTSSYLLKPSGFAIMRNGDDNESVYLNINFGKYAGWHSHHEQLSLNLWANNAPVIEELDRWGPYHNPLDILFRAPEAHNMMLVDGMVFDPRVAPAHDQHWQSTDSVDCFTACHRGYRFEVYGIKGPGCFNMNGVVRRTVIFVKDPGYALVMDSVYDENHAGFNRAVSQYWHSPAAFRVVNDGLVATDGCLLAFARTPTLRRLECTVDFAGEEVQYDGDYAERYSLRARRWGKVEEPGEPGFATVLYPHAGPAPDISIRPLPTTNGESWRADAFEITTPRGVDQVILNPERRPDIEVNGDAMPGLGRIILGNGRGTIEWT